MILDLFVGGMTGLLLGVCLPWMVLELGVAIPVGGVLGLFFIVLLQAAYKLQVMLAFWSLLLISAVIVWRVNTDRKAVRQTEGR